MNVIVSNRQKEIIDNANIDAIKDLNGLFNVNDLINKFKNYFFSRMILDATSVVDFASKEVLSTLANEIGSEKLIILLPSTPEPPLEFKKLLIELKIYNFTNDINDVIKFIEKPNTYEDAIKSIDNSFNNDVYVDNSIKEGEGDLNEDNSNEMVVNSSSQSSLGDILSSLNLNNVASDYDSNIENVNNTISELNKSDDNTLDNIQIDDTTNDINNIDEKSVNNEEINISNILDPVDHINSSNTTNDSANVFLINDNFDSSFKEMTPEMPKKIVIGIKNITSHAGATSLIYMLHRMISLNLKKEVLSIEVNKNDFRLFRNNKMISVVEDKLSDEINSSNEQIILVDLNECNNMTFCNRVLYLVEPSTIKLNELMATNRDIFKELKEKEVILNKSLLSPGDIKTLEGEAGINFFYNIEPLNDRIMNDTISKLLNLLGVN